MNFVRCFQSEWLKTRRSLASWLVILGAFFTPTIVIVAKLVRSGGLRGESVSPKFWETLWTSSWESIAILLLPLGLILATSLVTQLEFKNNAWKQALTTPQSLTTIYFAKLAVIVVMMVQFFALFDIGVYLSGIVPGLLTKGVQYPREAIPYLFFLKQELRYFTDCLPILGLEYLVSLQSSNFLVPVGGGIGLWIMSLSVLSWKYGYLFPYTYLGLYYFRVVGRYMAATQIHLWAMGYFVVFVAAGYVLFLTKRQKG
jgi:lantibiotic transport system permease protein